MKLKWNYKTFAAAFSLLLICAGCGGLSASRSVSPATFFMPGIMKAEPKTPSSDTVPKPAPVKQLAQVQ